MTRSTSVRLRATDQGDFETLRVLFDDPSFMGWGGSGRMPDDVIQRKYLGLRYPDVECFLVMLGNQAVGLAQIHVEPAGGGMDLILLPAARGHGIGRVVVADLAHRARAGRGWSRITVDPDLDNEEGIQFWQAVGFVPERTVNDNTGRSPYLVMVLAN